MERQRHGRRVRRASPRLVCRRSATDRRLLPHRPRGDSQRETMRASGTAVIAAGSSCVLAILAPLAIPAGAGAAATHDRCPERTTIALEVGGGLLCAAVDDPGHGIQAQLLRNWIDRSARIVADYYAGFPAPLVMLRIQAAPGDGVRGGCPMHETCLLHHATA